MPDPARQRPHLRFATDDGSDDRLPTDEEGLQEEFRRSSYKMPALTPEKGYGSWKVPALQERMCGRLSWPEAKANG